MKIVVFGSTGGVGQHVVRLARESGHAVTAFLRTPEKLHWREGVTIRVGNALDPDAVREAVAGHDAVISCLSSSAPMKPSDELERMTRHIVTGMTASGVRTISYCASAGVDHEIGGVLGKSIEWLLRHPLADHRRAIGEIVRADLDWTIARPTSLSDAPLALPYRESTTGVPNGPKTIPRASVAHFLIAAVEKPETYARASVGLAL